MQCLKAAYLIIWPLNVSFMKWYQMKLQPAKTSLRLAGLSPSSQQHLQRALGWLGAHADPSGSPLLRASVQALSKLQKVCYGAGSFTNTWSKLLHSHSTTTAGWAQRVRNEVCCEGWREIPQTLFDMFNGSSQKVGCDPHKTSQGKHSVFFVACAAWVKVMFSFSCAFNAWT